MTRNTKQILCLLTVALGVICAGCALHYVDVPTRILVFSLLVALAAVETMKGLSKP